MHPSPKHTRAFTFIELLVTMTLIAILASLAFPAFSLVMERARKTQAKNDLTQIVTAVNAYYTEYGKYPVVTNDTPITTDNSGLFYTLRAVALGANALDVANPRKIVFIQPPTSAAGNKSGLGSNGIWYDPWGSPYNIEIDGTYDNSLANPYVDAPGGATLNNGVIDWSLGKNGILGGGGPAPGFSSESGTANNFAGSSDVISWQ
jgi:prepilin-type N-terminal cleavage/methylation domain-containing protein